MGRASPPACAPAGRPRRLCPPRNSPGSPPASLSPVLAAGRQHATPFLRVRPQHRAFTSPGHAAAADTLPSKPSRAAIGPPSSRLSSARPTRAWETQRLLADLRPLYLRATELDRAQAHKALKSIRFTRRCGKPLTGTAGRRGGRRSRSSTSTARSARRCEPVASRITGAALDPSSNTWYAVGGNSQLGRLDPASMRFVGAEGECVWHETVVAGRRRRVRPGPPAPGGGEPERQRRRGGGALHARRRQAPGASHARRVPGYESLTWSEADDCYYALGQSYDAGGRAQAITRIGADGAVEWRDSRDRRLIDASQRGPAWPPQIAAAGPYLALVTAPLPDPLNPGAPISSGASSSTPRRCRSAIPARSPRTERRERGGEGASVLTLKPTDRRPCG